MQFKRRFLPTVLVAVLGLLHLTSKWLPITHQDWMSFAKNFVDPAVPVVTKASTGEIPSAKQNSDVKFHIRPKLLAKRAVTEDWKSFLGPNHNGVSGETRLLKQWPKAGPTLLWEMRKGMSYSAPAVTKDRLIFLHRLGNEEIVECLQPETGERYWSMRYSTEFEDRYGYGNGPRASPVIDEDYVFTYGAAGKLHCLNLETGQVVWRRDIATEFKVPQDFFGTATTPLIENDRLIINVGAPGGPCVAAFDKHSGKLLWGAGESWGPSYSSPVPAFVNEKRRVYVFAGGDSRPPTGGLLCLDPQTGKIDFEFPWRSRSYESVNASSPVAINNQVFVSASYRTGSALLDVESNGKSKVVWTTSEFGLHWNTAIHQQGFLYGFDGRNEPDATLACLELKTGRIVWRRSPEWEETITVNGTQQRNQASTLRGSLLRVDGLFLCLGELGHLLWLDLSPSGYKEVARTWLFAAKQTWTGPVICRGLLYVCQNAPGLYGEPPRLLCYDLRAED